MNLEKLPKIKTRKAKRLGRGFGSGKGGHTVGRGTKGQKSKGEIPLLFEGTKAKKSLLKRLPLQRGKGKFKSRKQKPLVVNLKYLSLYKKGELVNQKTLAKKGIIDGKAAQELGVKILGEGELKVALEVNLPCSKKAAKKIEKAGGKIIK